MNIIIREPIQLECGKLFTNHLQYRFHSQNISYSRMGDNAIRVEVQVLTCESKVCDELLDHIVQHTAGEKCGVSLMRESSGYYALQVYHD